jgi:hypothetical protein
MIRQSFGYGVMVDLCKRHGIWFDAEKLTCILDSVRAGGLAAADVELQVVTPCDEWADGHRTPERTTRSPLLAEDPYSGDGLVFPWVIAKVIGLLSRIFGH